MLGKCCLPEEETLECFEAVQPLLTGLQVFLHDLVGSGVISVLAEKLTILRLPVVQLLINGVVVT